MNIAHRSPYKQKDASDLLSSMDVENLPPFEQPQQQPIIQSFPTQNPLQLQQKAQNQLFDTNFFTFSNKKFLICALGSGICLLFTITFGVFILFQLIGVVLGTKSNGADNFDYTTFKQKRKVQASKPSKTPEDFVKKTELDEKMYEVLKRIAAERPELLSSQQNLDQTKKQIASTSTSTIKNPQSDAADVNNIVPKYEIKKKRREPKPKDAFKDPLFGDPEADEGEFGNLKDQFEKEDDLEDLVNEKKELESGGPSAN